MCTWHGSLKPTCQPHNKGISFDTTFHNGYYRGIITLRFRKYLHFAYSSSTFITYSPNLSPFLSTISHHLACQDVFPIARKTVTLSETGADCYNGCRLCSDQALAGSTISIPGFSGRDFAKIPGSRDFRDRD